MNYSSKSAWTIIVSSFHLLKNTEKKQIDVYIIIIVIIYGLPH